MFWSDFSLKMDFWNLGTKILNFEERNKTAILQRFSFPSFLFYAFHLQFALIGRYWAIYDGDQNFVHFLPKIAWYNATKMLFFGKIFGSIFTQKLWEDVQLLSHKVQKVSCRYLETFRSYGEYGGGGGVIFTHPPHVIVVLEIMKVIHIQSGMPWMKWRNKVPYPAFSEHGDFNLKDQVFWWPWWPKKDQVFSLQDKLCDALSLGVDRFSLRCAVSDISLWQFSTLYLQFVFGSEAVFWLCAGY